MRWMSLVLVYFVTRIQGKDDVLMSEPSASYQGKDVWSSSWSCTALWTDKQVGVHSRDYSYCLQSLSMAKNDWLRTGFIDVKKAAIVHFTVAFTMFKCSEYPSFPRCSQTFALHQYQRDEAVGGGGTGPSPDLADPAKTPGNFLFFQNITGTKFGKSNLNIVTVTVPMTKKGVYFAIKATGGCYTIKAVKVTFQSCPEKVVNLTKFSLTKTQTQKVLVTGECVENSASSQSINTTLECQTDGTWNLIRKVDAQCECDPGFQNNQNMTSCKACPTDHYKNGRGNHVCKACPDNSWTNNNTGASHCICKNGFNRPTDSQSVHVQCSVLTESDTSWIALLVTAIVFIIIVVVFLLICFFRRRKAKSKSRENDELLPLPGGQKHFVDPSAYDDPEEALRTFSKEIAVNCIKVDKLIGGGEFGEVYQGTLLEDEGKGRMTVAMKVLKPGASQKDRKDFFLEASIMGQFNDPNIVSLEGVVTKGGRIMIVTEFMSNGSLDNFLKEQDGLLSILQMIGMARGIASGMKYLSAMSFIHRDLAARNILVNDSLVCKVADFGLSRELEDAGEGEVSEYETQGGKIAVRWTAIEALRYRTFTTASDVWSFGIVLWEILSFGQRPYWDWGNLEVMERLESGYRLPPPMGCPKAVHQLMLDCWKIDRVKRPKFAELVQKLDKMIRSTDLLKDNSSSSDYQAKPPAEIDVANATISSWLGELNMSQYTENFTSAGFMTLSQVATMKESDLKRIGINLIGHRRKIFKSIGMLKVDNFGIALNNC